MKIQSGLEFLVITGAIGLLILSAVLQYRSTLGTAKGIANISFENYSIPSNQEYFSRPYIEIGIPQSSVADSQNYMKIEAYGCSNGTAHIELNSSSVEFDPSTINEAFYSVGVWQGSFYPYAGVDQISAKYSIYCGVTEYNGSVELSTVASGQNQQGSYQYSAYIYGRNEILDYGASEQKVITLVESQHCAYLTPMGTPFSTGAMCGSNAWGYNTETGRCIDLGTVDTTCIFPEYSGYNISSVNPSAVRYSYSSNVSIIGPKTFSTSISSANRSSAVFYMANQIGTAYIKNVSYAGSAPSISMLTGNSSGYVNSTAVIQYEQEWSSVYGILSYYNGAMVTSDVQSEIDQAVAAYDNYERRMISSATAQNQSQCRLNNNTFACAPMSPFYYVINATVSPKYFTGNQTISYAGSVIRVSG